MKSNENLPDVPTDKGPGGALIASQDYYNHVRAQLEAAVAPVSESDLEIEFSIAIRDIR